MKKMTLTVEKNDKGQLNVILDAGGLDPQEVMFILELEKARLVRAALLQADLADTGGLQCPTSP